MDEPILEALTFDLESDLLVSLKPSSDNSVVNPKKAKLNLSPIKFSAGRVLFNSFCSTPCLFSECSFISNQPLWNERGKAQYQEFLIHLEKNHEFVILNPNHIANLHRYVLYWKDKFSEAPFQEFCSNSNILTTDSGTQGTFMRINSTLQEEKELRNRLWTERLEAVLEVSRFEREQTDLVIQCLFCPEICTGNRTELLNHMYENHSFHMGNADNIVFIQELIQFLAETMASLKCIFCEKIFKDRTTLREHMRKKQHKQINPKNPDFDMYYLVNYLEPGKTWEDLDMEDRSDERREEEWMETKEENISIVCLFCSTQVCNFDLVLLHMKDCHKFDFEKCTDDKDFYEKVKIVNFIRRNMHQMTCLYCEMKFMDKQSLLNHLEMQHHKINSEFPSAKVWNRAEYFFPTYENDQFLILLEKDTCMDDDEISSIDSTNTEQNVIPEDPPLVSRSTSSAFFNDL